jgi:hypothetical protein
MTRHLIGCSLLAAAALWAQPNNRLTPQEKKEGWILLFDGKTLQGWEDPSKRTPPGNSFAVEDGCLKALKGPTYREDLFTLRKFVDFELQFDWRISPKGNSGLKYRVQNRQWVLERPGARIEDVVAQAYASGKSERVVGGQEYVVGFEYQCLDDSGHPDGLRGGSHSTGALYDFIAPSSHQWKPAGEFNHSRLVVKGSHVEHWLNGVKVVDADLKSPEIGRAAAKRWGAGSKVAEYLTKQPVQECPVSLQNHGDDAWFRNLKIRPLK